MAKDQKYWNEMKKIFNYTDEIVGKLSQEQKDVLEKAFDLGAWKLIAEVESCSNCAMHKPGDKYVFEPGGNLLKEESGPICVWAIANMLPFVFMACDRIVEGLDPNGMNLRYVRCADTTWKHGGVGEAIFRIRAEKK